MELDVDTFLTVVYCVCDEVYQREIGPKLGPRPGAQPKLSDSEILALAVLGQWHGHRCERCFLRYVRHHWLEYFPQLTSQSAFNRRVRHLWAGLCVLGPAIAREVSQLVGLQPTYQVWDGVPVPLLEQCRGERHRLFGDEASVGYGGSDRTEYYGMHLLAAANDLGVIEGFVVGPAATSEYWLAEALLRWRQHPTAPAPTAKQVAAILGPTHQKGGQRVGPTGPVGPRLAAGGHGPQPATARPMRLPILADLGFTGRRWRAHWLADYDTAVLTKADYHALTDPTERRRFKRGFNSRRQDIETVFSVLADRFGIKFPRSRSHWGTWTRLATKIAAFNVAVFINYLFERPPLALFNPLD